MATQEQDPNATSSNTPAVEKTRHAGIDGHELPLMDYDNTSLQEATDTHFTRDGELIIPENPSEGFAEKPLTAEEQEHLEQWRKKQAKRNMQPTRNKKGAVVAIGSLVAGVVFGGGALVYKMTGDNNNTEPQARSTAGAPTTVGSNPSAPIESTPSEVVNSPSQTPEYTGGITDEYVESVNRDPSDEVIAYSLEPVTTDKFSEREAVTRLLNDWKIYWLSGETSQSSDISQKETPESIAIGEQELNNLFGSEDVRDESNLLWEWMTGTREYLTANLGFFKVEYGYPEDGTFNSSFDILSEKSLYDGQVEFLVRNDWTSNMADLDPSIATQDTDADHFSTDRYITIGEFNGQYHITKIQSRAVVDQ
ncbi:MAG: hypothetical protein JWM00_130 [Candidatus Saccharibacteria bacterium]|nr:hypothetical protein [Candidatus Saccharibacteria bacterium]